MPLPTASILQSDGSTKTVNTLNSGRQAAADSASFAFSNEDYAALTSTAAVPVLPECPNYETIAASQTDQVMGSTGAVGDILSYIKIVPATTSPGAVSIKDGSGSSITLFTGGSGSVTTLIPFDTAWNAPSTGGAWKVTTGANVSAVAFGKFT